jgi:DNA ligase-1
VTLLAAIVATSQNVTATSARLAKVRELAACLRGLAPDEIEIGAQYLSGETRQGRFGLGYETLASASGNGAETEPALSVAEVDKRLEEIAAIRGAGATARRSEALRELFSRATVAERHFLMRLLIGELRQGALIGVMIDAIAAAAEVPGADVRRAAMYSKTIGAVARAALLEGSAGLAKFQLEILVPVAPMLAQTAADTSEALQQLEGDVAFEWKMDGARIQVHKLDETVRIYTRALNEVTTAVPEIAEAIGKLPVREVVLDGEAIAFTASGRPQPFQITMRRFGRKLNVEKLRAELPMHAFFFDCLRLDEKSLVDRPTRERYEVLAQVMPESMRIPRLVTASDDEASAFYDAALAAGHEGLMAKSLDSPYEAGNRGASWLKIKRAHTLDLVVLAAEWGHGRRTGKLSNLHLGALEPTTGEYVMLGKTFKGLTDAMLKWQTQEFLARETSRDQWTVYVRPEMVVEIAFSDLQASSRYPGGLALRLARVKRYRNDKSVEQADTMDSIRRIYKAQEGGG